MPDTQVVSDDNANASGEGGTGDSVSVESYKRLLAQRKADKARARALEEENNTLKAEREASEASKLQEANQFKELYEKEKKKRETAEGALSEMSTRQVTNAKKDALNKALGGVSKSEYLGFADLSTVQMNDDGTVDPESLNAVANKFRESYPELLPNRSASKLPNTAGKDYTPPAPKKLEDMTPQELREAYQKHNTKK